MITSYTSSNLLSVILLMLRYKKLTKTKDSRVHSRYRKKYYRTLSAYQRRIRHCCIPRIVLHSPSVCAWRAIYNSRVAFFLTCCLNTLMLQSGFQTLILLLHTRMQFVSEGSHILVHFCCTSRRTALESAREQICTPHKKLYPLNLCNTNQCKCTRFFAAHDPLITCGCRDFPRQRTKIFVNLYRSRCEMYNCVF
jgi:hypothetical protein